VLALAQTAAEQPARTAAEKFVVRREPALLFDHDLTLDWGISDTYHSRRQLQPSGFLALDAIARIQRRHQAPPSIQPNSAVCGRHILPVERAFEGKRRYERHQ
jgi:hypothetical protein